MKNKIRNLVLALLMGTLALLVSPCWATATAKGHLQGSGSVKIAGTKTVVILTSIIQSESEVTAFISLMKETPGIRGVRMLKGNGSVEVRYLPKSITTSAIRKKISILGYESPTKGTQKGDLQVIDYSIEFH